MYRCYGCDAPASEPCNCTEQQVQHDPWGWEPDDRPIDIQAGVRVNREEQAEYLC